MLLIVQLPIRKSFICYWQVKPIQYFFLEIFVRYEYRPTVLLFDTSKRVPDGSCTELSHNSAEGCHDSTYKMDLSDDINKSGTYFIGVLYEDNTSTNANYTMSILQERCHSWNRTDETWASHGCQVRYVVSILSIFVLYYNY